VARSPGWGTVAFQALVTFWSPGHAQFRDQPSTVTAPVSSTVTAAAKPRFQVLSEEVARQSLAGGSAGEPLGGKGSGFVVMRPFDGVPVVGSGRY
jgi:hypothetical protein